MSEDDNSDIGDCGPSHDGYCHFNENGSNTSFSISLFGIDLTINQNPASRSLGHGAVVWDAAVILAKYMEITPKDFNTSKLQGRKILELGSGCGLAGIAFMMRGAHVTFTDLPQVVDALTTYNAQKTYRQLVTLGGGGPSLQPPHIVPIDWTTFTPAVFGRTPDSYNSSIHDEVLVESLSHISLSRSCCDSDDRVETSASTLSLIPDIHSIDVEMHSSPATLEAPLLPIPPPISCEAVSTAIEEAIVVSSPTVLVNYSPPFDIVLLTDCVFSVLLVEPLINTILACSNTKTEVICCHEIRDEEANAYFVSELKKHFAVKRIPRTKLHPEYRNNLVEVLSAKLIREKKKK